MNPWMMAKSFSKPRFKVGTGDLRFVFLIFLLVCHIGIGQALKRGGSGGRGSGSKRPGTASTKTSSRSTPKTQPPGAMTEDDFHQLTDKLTAKILKDIDKMKAQDPDWGKPKEGESGMEEDKKTSECEFYCPDGLVQEDNEDFSMPAFKNCRDYDHSWDNIPLASDCCARHQRCYYTCRRDRAQCDIEFGSCMQNICGHLKEEGKIASEDVEKACQSAMGLLGMIIMEPGCKLYPKAQGAACQCVEGVEGHQPSPSSGDLEPTCSGPGTTGGAGGGGSAGCSATPDRNHHYKKPEEERRDGKKNSQQEQQKEQRQDQQERKDTPDKQFVVEDGETGHHKDEL